MLQNFLLKPLRLLVSLMNLGKELKILAPQKAKALCPLVSLHLGNERIQLATKIQLGNKTMQLCLRSMVDFVHRFCIRSVKTLCYACSVMVLFSSSLLRKFLVFCGLVKVLGPWCTINFRLVQFVNIQDYWITLFLLFLILVISLWQNANKAILSTKYHSRIWTGQWPRKGLVCKQSKSATQENHTSVN